MCMTFIFESYRHVFALNYIALLFQGTQSTMKFQSLDRTTFFLINGLHYVLSAKFPSK